MKPWFWNHFNQNEKKKVCVNLASADNYISCLDGRVVAWFCSLTAPLLSSSRLPCFWSRSVNRTWPRSGVLGSCPPSALGEVRFMLSFPCFILSIAPNSGLSYAEVQLYYWYKYRFKLIYSKKDEMVFKEETIWYKHKAIFQTCKKRKKHNT